jgi:excinuclease ABC subunit C
MSSNININLNAQIKVLENKPGVYQFYDDQDILLYVGKAKKLKNRVSSYFSKVKFENRKTKVMVGKVCYVKTIHLDSEMDALLLENALIKKHQPRYNIQLKDDKTYPWICIKNELFPRIFYTRKKLKDGSQYFGPYPSVKIVKTVIDLVKESFEIRSCDHQLTKEKIENEFFNTAVDFYIGNCKGCCQGKVNETEYKNRLDLVKQVLNGQTSKVLKQLRASMKERAQIYQYEEAEEIKLKIKNIERFQAKSAVVDNNITNVGVMNIVSYNNYAFVNAFIVMNGAITKTKSITIQRKLEEPEEVILALVLADNFKDFFNSITEIILPLEIPLADSLNIHIPQRGDKRTLLLLSKKNAIAKKMEFQKAESLKDPSASLNNLLAIIKSDLRLKISPVHMECFDNSNIQGNYPVAACVVFKNAKPSKKDYRHFNIKTVEGPNDFASMEEVIFRRYQRLINEKQPLPQLIIVDGGKGQLSSAVKSLNRLNILGKVAVIGIAKRLEEIYFPGDQYPLYLDKKTPTLKVVQQMRNEAHRFGINFHRLKRSKGTVNTVLSSIEGIGEKTAILLLKKYKSIKQIKEKSLDELSLEIGKSKAQKVYSELHVK